MMKIPFSPPDISELEIAEVVSALRSGWITTGPKTKELEKRMAAYCQTSTFVCLNSATAAMELTLRLLGVGVGDEVIVPAYTYTATASVVAHVGATIVMVDCAKDSLEMDYEQVANAITSKTKVIIPVDLAGIICDYDKIYQIIEAKKHLFQANSELQKHFNRIVVLSDCAHGFGAMKNGLAAGRHADFTSFSFHAVKNLTTAEGGGVTWKDESLNQYNLYQQYMEASLHGQSKDALAKMKPGAWEYDIVYPAYKCNMTDLQAAVGLAQLSRYETMLERRHQIIQAYDETLKAFDVKTLKHTGENYCSSGHLYLMNVNGFHEEQRNELIVALANQGIATNVHYKPLPMMSAYKKLGFDIKDYPNAYAHYQNEITLPLYSALSDEQLAYIIEVLQKCLKENLC
jgi:dTDP-4-amino-4,6-dideoxygalactose transaminase